MEDNSTDLKWYVVHTYSGHEKKVKASLEKVVESLNMEELITNIEVPLEEYSEKKDGVVKKKVRKIFPGYVVVKMVMNDRTWYVVRNTKGVTGFVGPGSKPVALTEHELRNMGIVEKRASIDFKVGDNVNVIDGPFTDSIGVVTSINESRMTITVSINIFGRETPVELEYYQAKKL